MHASSVMHARSLYTRFYLFFYLNTTPYSLASTIHTATLGCLCGTCVPLVPTAVSHPDFNCIAMDGRVTAASINLPFQSTKDLLLRLPAPSHPPPVSLAPSHLPRLTRSISPSPSHPSRLTRQAAAARVVAARAAAPRAAAARAAAAKGRRRRGRQW